MKKSNVKLFILFGFILFLSVGYAVVNSVSLSVTGTARARSKTLDVYFTGNTSVSNNDKATATAVTNGRTGTMNVKNLVLNETVSLEYEITNDETDVDASLEILYPASTDYFEVSIDEKTGHGSSTPILAYGMNDYYVRQVAIWRPTRISKTFVIPAGETKTYVLSVKLIKTPISSYDDYLYFDITIEASPVNSSV